MRTQCLGIVTVAAILSGLVGCGKKEADNRLTEIAIKVHRQEAKIEEMAGRVQGIESSLRDIRDSLREIALGHGQGDRAEAQETPARETEGTSDFEQVAAAISDIQHRLNLVEGSLEGVKPEHVADAVAGLRRQLQVVEDHQEMGNRLDALLQQFAWQIDDPTRREEFQADLEKLKQTLGEPIQNVMTFREPTQNLFNVAGVVIPKGDEGANTHSELEAAHLQPNAVQFNDTLSTPATTEWTFVTRVQLPDTRSRLADLVTKYDIPIDVLKDVGLASMEPSQAKPDPRSTPTLLPKLTTVKRKTI